jgi:hypothetical protein
MDIDIGGVQADDGQIGDGELGYDVTGEGVGDGDMGDYGDGDHRMGHDSIGGGYDATGEGVGDGDEGDYGDGDHGMGYDGDSAAQHAPGSPLFSLGGEHVSWPGDAGYDKHMRDPRAMDQDLDAAALWGSQRGGGVQYRAAADRMLPSLHLEVPQNPGFHSSRDHPVIPLDPDAIVNHYDTPRKSK